jgi:hypothetical protein
MKLLILLSLLLSACRAGPSDAQISALADQLETSFPALVASVSYEYAPPLDPPTLFIDMAPGVSTGAELSFLCANVGPLVDAVDDRIDATTTYGYYLRTDCVHP